MRTLKLSTDHFDLSTMFTVDVGKRFPARVRLHLGYKKNDDGIYWGLATGATLKSSYTAEDIALTERLNSETPIKNGDKVSINGYTHVARVLGDYSNCVIFDPLYIKKPFDAFYELVDELMCAVPANEIGEDVQELEAQFKADAPEGYRFVHFDPSEDSWNPATEGFITHQGVDILSGNKCTCVTMEAVYVKTGA